MLFDALLCRAKGSRRPLYLCAGREPSQICVADRSTLVRTALLLLPLPSFVSAPKDSEMASSFIGLLVAIAMRSGLSITGTVQSVNAVQGTIVLSSAHLHQPGQEGGEGEYLGTRALSRTEVVGLEVISVRKEGEHQQPQQQRSGERRQPRTASSGPSQNRQQQVSPALPSRTFARPSSATHLTSLALLSRTLSSITSLNLRTTLLSSPTQTPRPIPTSRVPIPSPSRPPLDPRGNRKRTRGRVGRRVGRQCRADGRLGTRQMGIGVLLRAREGIRG